MRTLWIHGRLSRWELHEQTGLSPNGVGTLADALLRAGMIRECPPEPAKMGRPRVPLEIDPSTQQMLGLAVVPGRAEIARLGLTGVVQESDAASEVSGPAGLIDGAAALLASHLTPRTLGVGITSTGFLDPVEHTILFSSALPGRGVESLTPIFDAVGDRPAVLGNDMHALAARWLLTHRAEQRQDVLLVWFTDGRLGSALLIDGRPNRGCATGANELGHTRFLVETEQCFCGQKGCVERIVSTPFLQRWDAQNHAKARGTLAERVIDYQPDDGDGALEQLLVYLTHALSNAVNFIRPHRLVLVSPMMRHTAFAAAISNRTRRLVLPELAGRVMIDWWDQASTGSAENAGWLALAELLYGGWHAGTPSPERVG